MVAVFFWLRAGPGRGGGSHFLVTEAGALISSAVGERVWRRLKFARGILVRSPEFRQLLGSEAAGFWKKEGQNQRRPPDFNEFQSSKSLKND